MLEGNFKKIVNDDNVVPVKMRNIPTLNDICSRFDKKPEKR